MGEGFIFDMLACWMRFVISNSISCCIWSLAAAIYSETKLLAAA